MKNFTKVLLAAATAFGGWVASNPQAVAHVVAAHPWLSAVGTVAAFVGAILHSPQQPPQ